MDLEENPFKEITDNNSFFWILFHTSSQKIKVLYDKIVVNKLIEHVIIPICNAHPCSICRTDSMTYLESKQNFKHVYCREELIYELYVFHNVINAKLNKKQFDFDLLHKLYKNYKLIHIINKIKQVINDTNTLIDINFKEIIVTAIKWLENNIYLFEA
jgi:hypothetical protein